MNFPKVARRRWEKNELKLNEKNRQEEERSRICADDLLTCKRKKFDICLYRGCAILIVKYDSMSIARVGFVFSFLIYTVLIEAGHKMNIESKYVNTYKFIRKLWWYSYRLLALCIHISFLLVTFLFFTLMMMMTFRWRNCFFSSLSSKRCVWCSFVCMVPNGCALFWI